MRLCVPWVALALASGLSLQCGGTKPAASAFSTTWQNDQGQSIAAVWERLRAVELPAGAPVAVGVTEDGLVGRPLDDGKVWTYDGEIDSRPTITGDVVVATGAGRVIALDARTGRLLWTTTSGGRSLRGAGDNGSVTVAALGAANGGHSLLLAIDRNGSEVQAINSEEEIGVPAVMGDIAFVPWGQQYVSAIDLGSGKEIGRLLMRDQVSHARNVGGDIYFGEDRLLRWDEKSRAASTGGGNRWVLPKRELPGEPRLLGAGSQVRPITSNAADKIRWYVRPVITADGVHADSDRVAATYFDAVMGFASNDGSFEWAVLLPATPLGGDGAKGGFVFCDDKGFVTLIDAQSGMQAGQIELGQDLLSCAVQANMLTVSPTPADRPMTERLGEVVRSPRAQLAPAQTILLRELSKLEDPIVTKVLIEIVTDPRTPKPMLAEARKQLAQRRNGGEYMLTALSEHYDFLDDVLRSPPVGPLADALAAMDEKRAAPLLAEHLNDPADSPADVARAARALEKLASKQELPEMRTFFALYRATATDQQMVRAVISTARAMLRVGGDSERTFLRMAAEDPLTNAEVRQALRGMVG